MPDTVDPTLDALKHTASRILNRFIEEQNYGTGIDAIDVARISDELVQAARSHGHRHTPHTVTIGGNVQIIMLDGEKAASFAIRAVDHG